MDDPAATGHGPERPGRPERPERPKRNAGRTGPGSSGKRGVPRTKRHRSPRRGAGRDERDAWKICTQQALTQRGIVTRAQLIRAGVSPDWIKRWSRRGALHRLYPGVYAVGHVALSPLARLQAAVLACGPKAVVSHASAAFLWGLRESLPATIDITLVGRQLRPKRGIRLHRVTSVDHRDLRRRDGLPVTSPARMAIDLAPQLDLDQLDELIAEARVKRLIRPGELEAAMQRAGPCSGRARTRRALAAEGDPGLTRSRAERMLRRLLREGRLPEPRTNVRLGPYEVDFLWEEQRLIVEFDSWRFHGHRRAFENDRSKDVALTNAGYEVLRFTWRQLETEPLVVLAAIARALGRRGLAVV